MFYRCIGFTSYTFPANIKSVGDYSFYGCANIKEFELPNNILSVGSYSFAFCINMDTFTYEYSSLGLSPYTFMNCSKLTNINLPKNIDIIPDGLFYGCTALYDQVLTDSVPSTLLNFSQFFFLKKNYYFVT